MTTQIETATQTARAVRNARYNAIETARLAFCASGTQATLVALGEAHSAYHDAAFAHRAAAYAEVSGTPSQYTPQTFADAHGIATLTHAQHVQTNAYGYSLHNPEAAAFYQLARAYTRWHDYRFNFAYQTTATCP